VVTCEERDWRGRSFPIGTSTMSALADTLVTLGVDEEGGRLRRTITIGKARNTRCDLRVRDSVLTANAVTGESYQHARFSIDSKAHSAADAAVTPEPFEARLRAPRQILVMDEEVLEQLEPR